MIDTAETNLDHINSEKSANENSKEPSQEEDSYPYSGGASFEDHRKMISGIDRDINRVAKEDSHKTHFFKLIYKTVCDLIYPHLILDHLDSQSLKTVLRSWLLMWSLTLLCICGGTIDFMGPSSFLSTFSAGIEIAGNLSVSAAFAIGMADICSVTFAFLISVVTGAINWRIRGYPSEADVVKQLLASGYCRNLTETPNFENCILPKMHDGYFLETKTTAVTVFGMLFSFTMCGYYQSVSKYAKLAWLLNSLLTIIVFPFNNMMPVWRPWFYARNVVVPMGMAFATRFAVSLIILPFSSNYKVVSSLSTACKRLSSVSDKVQTLSNSTDPSKEGFSSNFTFIGKETQTIFTKLIINEMDFELVQNLEVWFSRFEKPDLSELRSRVRLVLSALSSFNFFYEAMEDEYLDTKASPELAAKKYKIPTNSIRKHRRSAFWNDRLQKVWKDTGEFELLIKKKFYYENKSHFDEMIMSRDTTKVYTDIVESHQPLIILANNTLAATGDWLELAGGVPYLTPWRNANGFNQRFEVMRDCLSELGREIKYANSKKVSTNRIDALHDYVTLHFAKRVASLAQWCSMIHRDRPRPRLVWPFKSTDNVPSEILEEADDFAFDGFHDNLGNALRKTGFNPVKNVQARDPDSSPPRLSVHLFGQFVEKLGAFFYDKDLLFCVKRAMLTVVTLTPYFCRPTAHQAFRHWYLWVAVLTAYTIGRQAVDGVYGLFAKLAYTFFGCLVGMVGWYISAGSGRGNPFSYATVTAFIWLYICFQRQFNKHFAPATSIVYSCTVSLVLGNSWNAGHNMIDGVDLGKGFSPAWVRFVTVAIGLTVAFLGTVFPHVYTAKRAVREIVGNSLEHIGTLQSSISNFAVQRYKVPGTNIVAHTDSITKEARAIITNLNSAETLRKRLVYEPPLSGIYPTHRYKLLISYVNEIALLYSLSYSFLDDIEDTSKMPRVLKSMGWSDPHLTTGTYSVLYMCCRSLFDAKALPSITSGSLYEQYMFITLPSIGKTMLDYDLTNSEDPVITTAVALSSQIYRRLDGVVLLIKDLVGEVYDIDMDVFTLSD